MKILLRWHDVLANEKKKVYFSSILETITREKKSEITIYPLQKDIFNAFRLTELCDVKVVILGQDPYCKPGQAHGLAFSVPFGVTPPPSLLNVYKELKKSIPKFSKPNHGCLENWARQGVFLLNSILTVRSGETFSHAKIGWETFTDRTISLINRYQNGVVFLLWGAFAQRKENLIDKKRHCVLKTTHPSPLSAHRGFFGCNHFALANQWLKENGKKQIDWLL